MNAAFRSSLSAWHEVEQRMDRWVSIGALAFAGIAVALFLALGQR